MTDTKLHDEIRTIDAGGWYWVSKAVIQEYAPKVGFLPLCIYHLLASMVDESQSCYPSQKYIAQKLGCSRSSVSRAIKILVKHDLVRLTRGANSHGVYQLLRVRSCSNATRMSHHCNSDVAQVDTNNTKLTRINNNTFVGVSLKKPFNESRLTTKERLLASDIAETLNDQRNIKRYFSYACIYPEIVLRELLSQVKQIPSHSIKKSRAALFAYLVKHYEQNTA
jgi:DNA-binding MarR family transcriptional regulator